MNEFVVAIKRTKYRLCRGKSISATRDIPRRRQDDVVIRTAVRIVPVKLASTPSGVETRNPESQAFSRH
jgi:hypothetical protein